jgi:hypothetical protein
MVTQTNVDADKIASGKHKLEDGVVAYKAANAAMAAAAAKWHACAGDENIDGGLPGRADKGKEATDKLGGATHKSTAKDADAIDTAHKKYTPQDEDQGKNIKKSMELTGQEKDKLASVLAARTDQPPAQSPGPSSGTNPNPPL